jgi:hypothetical protein
MQLWRVSTDPVVSTLFLVSSAAVIADTFAYIAAFQSYMHSAAISAGVQLPSTMPGNMQMQSQY